MVLESYSHRVFPSKMCATTYNEHGCLFYITIKQLLQFLNNIYRENCIPDEWRNAVITPIFKKGDRKEPKNYRGINMKLQDFSEAFMKEPQNGFRKGTVMHRFNILP